MLQNNKLVIKWLKKTNLTVFLYMKKTKFINLLSEIFGSTKYVSCTIFLTFAILFTVLLSFKYFLFQTIISHDGISQKDITAPKTIEVTDVFKTEQQRKEVTQKIAPILTPAEDAYIKSNLSVLEKSVWEIKDKSTSNESKRVELSTLFDIKDKSRKQLIIDYLMTAQKNDIDLTFRKANQTLDDILSAGVTEEDFNNIYNIIFRNIKHDIARNKIAIISGILEQVIVPNLIVDEKATMIARQNASNSVKPVIVRFEKGDKIVFEGEPVTKLKRDALNQAGYNVMELNWKGILAIFAFVLTGIISLIYYMYFFYRQFLTKSYLSIIAVLSIFMGVLAVVLPDVSPSGEKWSEFILPFPAFAMLITSFINSRVSIVTSIVLLVVLSTSMQFPMPTVVIFSIIIIISSITVSRIKYARRFDLIKTGIEVSVAMIFLIISSYAMQSCVNEIDIKELKTDLMLGFINGIVSGMIVLGVIPILESLFKIITPYGLVEYGETNHPLLKRLQEAAPGTFSHSLMVSNLCETAAEAIGADPILAKVGALYHDVGKLKRPLFFVENQTYGGIENPHNNLTPRLSKMVITAHTRDGIDLAKEYGLPPIIQNFIIQHHGESLAGYFYTQAVQQEGKENVIEEQFRYAGIKPNMKETAILMIADSVESASRTLKDFSEEAVENMVNKIITDKLNDGQLSDSPLTLKDLKTIAQSLSKSLRAAHHQRIKYNDIEDLKNIGFKKPSKMAEPSILAGTDEKDKINKKIEKKIEKRLEKEKNNEKSLDKDLEKGFNKNFDNGNQNNED